MLNGEKRMSTFTTLFTNKSSKSLIILILLIVLLPIISAICISAGVYNVTLGDVFKLFSLDPSSGDYRIIMHVRLPRVLGAILAGGALATSGAIIQSVLNNPLASPNIIGVNTGAGLFVLLFSAFFGTQLAIMPIVAFIGAVLTSAVIIIISVGGRTSKLTVVLTGIAISSIMTAGMNTIMIVDPDAYIGAGTFLVGGLSGLTINRIVFPMIYILIALLISFCYGKDMNVLALGESTAKSLGMSVNRKRIILIILAAVLAGSAVSFAGLIGFVGLIVPHAVRYIIGSDNRFVLPVSAVSGSIFVLICDTVSRTLFNPYELPVGIIMAFIGGPFFVFLIVKSRKRNND